MKCLLLLVALTTCSGCGFMYDVARVSMLHTSPPTHTYSDPYTANVYKQLRQNAQQELVDNMNIELRARRWDRILGN
jgi:hypothetical protein